MRKNIVAGNWKMNKNLQDGIALMEELKTKIEKPNCDVIVCTPFIHLADAARIFKGTIVKTGAENCSEHQSGAYTGEVSAEMVRSTGVEYCIIGHSERRAYFNETPEMLREKVLLALENGLRPIFCVGEVKEQREQGIQNQVVESQIRESLFNLTAEQFAQVVVAYEPVWAIGTGLTATPDQAEEIHAHIRSLIERQYGHDTAENTSILYGGSCKPGNARELFAKPDIDGGLIGGAALKADDFIGIIKAF